MDITKLKPRRDWTLVLADPRRVATQGGIFLPGHETGVEKVTEGAGLIIAVGPGEKNAGLKIEKGDRILYRAFLKHANRMETDEVWENGEAKCYFLMNSDDILGVMAPGVDVGVFSGRPENRTEGR